MKKPMVLIIRDGWGYSPREESNAIAAGNTPNHDSYIRTYPTALIKASGLAVGLPKGYQGSSQVGHLNLGAGRVVYQTLVRINKEIEEGTFFNNHVYTEGIRSAINKGTNVHMIGLVQDQGVHSHTDHLLALMKLAKDAALPADKCLVHVFTDGRDTPPRSAKEYLKPVNEFIEQESFGIIASVCGRYFSMDRDNRWDRVKAAYDMLASGISECPSFSSAEEAVEDAYAADESDEFIKPRILGDFSGIQEGDCVIHFNYRLDRTRELTRAFIEDGFEEFKTVDYNDLSYICTTEYYAGIAVSSRAKVTVAFANPDFSNLFGKFLADNGLTQLRAAETEKYAHVTFFFNGESDDVFENEDRYLVKSPEVATYDLKPEMSAYEVKDAVLEKISSDEYDVIIMNYANGDMVGHTGIMKAAVSAVEAVDECVGAVTDAVLEKDGIVFLTGDHGNAEQMVDYDTGEPFTAHTTNDVWFSLISNREELQKGVIDLKEGGALCDVVPTMIDVMGMEKPAVMNGISLIKRTQTGTVV